MTVTIDNQECFWPNIFKEIESFKFPLTSLNESLDLNQTVLLLLLLLILKLKLFIIL